MKIRTRLQVMTAASVALLVIMALLFSWSQQRLAAANRAKNFADEIVSSVFERKALTSDYLRNNNPLAKDKWLAKQQQIIGLLQEKSAELGEINHKQTFDVILKSLEKSSTIFHQIVSNRENVSDGDRLPPAASEIENRLVAELLVDFLETIAESHQLQTASNALIASTQRTAAAVSLFMVFGVAFFMIAVAWSLSRIISQGIASLQQGATAVGAGNLHYTIPIIAEDEFAHVAEAFNTMSGKLAESHAALEKDIVARQRTAAEIDGLNQNLSYTVAQLQGANQELEAFAYSVSHDLRAPLRAMGGFSEALLEDYGDTLEAEARDYLNEIIIGSRHMGQLLDGLLTLSRSTRGELSHDQVDLSAMAERIRCELEKAEPGRDVVWEIEPGLGAGGDGRMIEVIMRNLLDNAWKYSTATLAPVIRVYGEAAGNEAFFCVADNGAGFDMAHAEKLFQPFQRLHRPDEFPGIGIGLATAQRIIHRHGGIIEATGAPRQGATFRFSLAQREEQSMEKI